MPFNEMIPMLSVADVAATRQWFFDNLGFEPEGDPDSFGEEGRMLWCMMRADDVKLMLTTGRSFANDNADRRLGRNCTTLYFYPDDVMPLYDRLKANGVAVSEPFVTFYGMKEINIEDGPDGYRFTFGSPTDEPPDECE